jgi:hypothetical protein
MIRTGIVQGLASDWYSCRKFNDVCNPAAALSYPVKRVFQPDAQHLIQRRHLGDWLSADAVFHDDARLDRREHQPLSRPGASSLSIPDSATTRARSIFWRAAAIAYADDFLLMMYATLLLIPLVLLLLRRPAAAGIQAAANPHG